jgi:hypothetical protein
MDTSVRIAPPPGSANVGDLYVDLQTRTLWLGVDTAIDPAGFVLVSDMLTLQSDIVGSLAESKAYTDSQIVTRAPIVHTHTSAQIVDFTEAVTAIAGSIPGLAFIRGMILQWSGSIVEIGVGDLAGWALCDGTNGTPNLADKFIIGAGNKPVGPPSPAQPTTITTTGGGTHVHTINPTAITIDQMPSHNHTPGTGGESTDHAHHFSANTGGQSANHTHNVPQGTGGGGSGGSDTDGHAPVAFYVTSTGFSADHYHGVSGWSGGRNAGHTHGVYHQGGNAGHTHTILGGGGIHEHSISATQLRDTLPWYALAYIMKL